MTDAYIALSRLWPELPGNVILHTVNCSRDELVDWLTEVGFSIIEFSGRVGDEQVFFREAAQALGFEAEYLGNWDAWVDCLTEWSWTAPSHVAIVWSDSDSVFEQNAYLFSQVVADLNEIARAMALMNKATPKQVEVLLLGKTEGFPKLSLPHRS